MEQSSNRSGRRSGDADFLKPLDGDFLSPRLALHGSAVLPAAMSLAKSRWPHRVSRLQDLLCDMLAICGDARTSIHLCRRRSIA